MPVVTSVSRSLPPSGTAAGDLSGTYPGPTVAKVNGIAVTGTPSIGYVPTATSASAATWQAVGGLAPTTRAQYGNGTQPSIANGASALLDWGTLQAGTALLNLTAPTVPTIVTAGIYAVTFAVSMTSTAAGNITGTLDMDLAGDDAQLQTYGLATLGAAGTTGTLVYYCPAGAVLGFTCANGDGVSARTPNFSSVIQRIS